MDVASPSPTLELSDRVREFLAKPNYATLATVGADGDAAPGRDLVSASRTTAGSSSTAAPGAAGRPSSRRDRRCSLAVTDRDDPFTWVGLQAVVEAVIETSTVAREDIVALSVHYGEVSADERGTLPKPAPDLVPAAHRRRPRPPRRLSGTADVAPVRFGLQLWPQNTTWPEYREATLAAEAARLGLDLDVGPPARDPGPVGAADLRGLGRSCTPSPRSRSGSASGSWSARTRSGTRASRRSSRRRSTTSPNGRAVLGIGGAWFEREHEAFGIDFGASVGERLDKLEEAVPLMRRLFDGERVSHEGRFYTLVDALCEPRPDPGPPADPRRRERPEEDAAHGRAPRRRLEHERRPSRP